MGVQPKKEDINNIFGPQYGRQIEIHLHEIIGLTNDAELGEFIESRLKSAGFNMDSEIVRITDPLNARYIYQQKEGV